MRLLPTKAITDWLIAAGTLLGSLQTDLLNDSIAEATSLAQKYIPAAKP